MRRIALVHEAAAWEGHPDNVAPALLGGLVVATRGPGGELTTLRMPLSDAVGFAFAAPATGLATADARAALPATVPHAAAARMPGRFAALLRGLATADPALIRIGFTDELHMPYRLPLVERGADVIAAALAAGAWAATLSGAGSGIIAVAPPARVEEIARAMGGAFEGRRGPATWFALKPDTIGARLEG